MIDLNHITQILIKRSRESFPICQTWSDSDCMLELLGEAGEAANVVKKMNRGGGDRDQLRAQLAEEFSDIFICLLLNAARHNIDLEAALPSKFNQTSVKLGSEFRLDPTQPINSVRIYGLSFYQIIGLIEFFRKKTGIEDLSSLTKDEILNAKERGL